MGFDVGEETAKVVAGGLPELPAELAPSQDRPLADAGGATERIA